MKREFSDEHKRKLNEAHKGQKAWNKGLTKETDERIMKFAKAKEGVLRPDMVGNNWGVYGNKPGPEGRKRLSERMKKDNPMKHQKNKDKMVESRKWYTSNPKLHYNYINGRSFLSYPPEFNISLKRKIRKIYNHICQICGKTKEELKRKIDVHHIDYNKNNCNESNLITLCNSCNVKANYNRDYYQKILNNKVENYEN